MKWGEQNEACLSKTRFDMLSSRRLEETLATKKTSKKVGNNTFPQEYIS